MKHLRHEADCLAWPWLSMEEFRRGACTVDRARGLLELRERMKQHGRPEITRELCDRTWQHGERLWSMLPALASRLLVRDRESFHLRPDTELPGREILRWRYLGLSLPPGLLAAAAAVDGRRPPLHIDILHSSFAPVGPVAHLHLHVGAAGSFELLWTHLMSRRDRLRLRGDVKLPAGCTVQNWTALLVRAGLARRVLAALGRRPGTTVEAVARRLGGDDADLVCDALAQLVAGCIKPGGRLAEAIMFRAATRTSRVWRRPRATVDVWRNDPIDDGEDWPEGAMLAAVFDQLRADAAGRDRPGPLERLFVQYLRTKCLLYRILVHDPTDHGLDGFVHTFRQIGPYREGLDLVLNDFAMAERGIDLCSLEVRTSPPATVSDVRAAVDGLLATAARQPRELEVGWIFHFIRDGRGKTTGQRYQSIHRKIQRDAARLRLALDLRPELLWTMRGLDIAGSEREGPLWLAAPFFQRLRAQSQRLAVSSGVPPLQLTLHVGEDFRHLATGLRSIHEPLQWGLVQRGDRLGHALALGLDPVKWCDQNPRVLLPRWERILDLAWMIGALAGFSSDLQLHGDGLGLLLSRMRRELAAHLDDLQLGALNPDAVVELHRSRLVGAGALQQVMDRRLERRAPDDPLYLIHIRLFGGPAVQARLDAPCTVETAGELPLLQALSQSLVRLVALWQLTIEVNPSSNLLIAGFDDPLDQPIFRMHPLDPGTGIALPITLNADDPLTFATSLADEYAYAWAALVLVAGVPPGRAQAWLHEAGCASWRAKFTLPSPRARNGVGARLPRT